MNGLAPHRDELVADLRRAVEKLEGGRPAEDKRPLSTRSPALDRMLPGGGLARGTLVEYLSAAGSSGGGGAATLSLAAAREACGEGRALVVVERESSKFKVQSSKFGNRGQERGGRGEESIGRFYPPAAAAWGIDLSAMLVLRTASEADALWAFDQALRCPGVGAVWGAWERLDVRDFRRLQLAAEVGGTVGLLIRPATLRKQPTWAEVRFLIHPKSLVGSKFKVQGSKFKVAKLPTFDFLISAWQLEVELVRCRGAAGGQRVVLELDETSGQWREVGYEAARAVSVFAELADPAGARRA